MEQDSADQCMADLGPRYPQIDLEVEGVVDRLDWIQKHLGRIFEETLAVRGLNRGEYKLLLRLATRAEDHRISAGDLSRMLMLSTGAMTNRLDRLEAAGLVRRIPDPRDRRGVLIELTSKGEKVIDDAVITQASHEAEVLGALNAKERTQLNQLLRKVLISLEARPAQEGRKTAAG
jgi:DNA-binding MarR family transcriptional regulator